MAIDWNAPATRASVLALSAIVLLGFAACDSSVPRPAPAAPIRDSSFNAPVDFTSDAGAAKRGEDRVAELKNVEPFHPVEASNADMSLRNDDYPHTYIESIHVDLTSPHHWVTLTWTGPRADRQETGPFHSSPGRGLGYNDCDNTDESTRNGSNCTPKGENVVEGFSDYLPTYPRCKFVTWFNKSRQIAFHSHWQVPYYPASHGCVRLPAHAAQLIHNNSRIGETRVIVDGTWSR